MLPPDPVASARNPHGALKPRTPRVLQVTAAVGEELMRVLSPIAHDALESLPSAIDSIEPPLCNVNLALRGVKPPNEKCRRFAPFRYALRRVNV